MVDGAHQRQLGVLDAKRPGGGRGDAVLDVDHVEPPGHGGGQAGGEGVDRGEDPFLEGPAGLRSREDGVGRPQRPVEPGGRIPDGEDMDRAAQVVQRLGELDGVHRPAAGAGRIGDEGDPGKVPHVPLRSSANDGLRAAIAAASKAARVAVGARRQPASCSAARCFDRTWGSASVPST